MPNMINNELKIEAHKICTDALLKFQQEIESEAVKIARNHTIEKGDSLTLEMSFRTHDKPPIAVYKEIEAYMQEHNIGSAALEAEATFLNEGDNYDTRWGWLFNGEQYEAIESDLTYSQKEKARQAAQQAAEDLLRERIEEMGQERDDLTTAIRVMKRRYMELEIPF